jgi:hypothetical protein
MAETSQKSLQTVHALRNGRNGVCADATPAAANDKPAYRA